MQIAHVQQGAHKGGQAVQLLPQGADQPGSFGVHGRVFLCKQLQLCLQNSQRGAQLVGGVARKLPLQLKGLRQPVQHLIYRPAQLPEFLHRVFVQTGSGNTVLIDPLCLLRKLLQRFQRSAADKIGNGSAEDGDHGGDAPALAAKNHLCIVDLLRKMRQQAGHFLLWDLDGQGIRAAGLVLHHKAVEGIHADGTGAVQKQVHAHAGAGDEQRCQQGDAPLQR